MNMYPYNLQQQLSPEIARHHVPLQLPPSDPLLVQARCVLSESSNYVECKMLCLRNRECIIYLTPEIRDALRNIPPQHITNAICDGTDRGMKRYTIDNHEFWAFKRYEASVLHDNLLSYGTFQPYLFSVRKYSRRFFAKQALLLALLFIITMLLFTFAIVLSNEIVSYIAAGACMFIAGFSFLFFIKLYNKATHNPTTVHCNVSQLLEREHSIPHVFFTTDDTSEIL